MEEGYAGWGGDNGEEVIDVRLVVSGRVLVLGHGGWKWEGEERVQIKEKVEAKK